MSERGKSLRVSPETISDLSKHLAQLTANSLASKLSAWAETKMAAVEERATAVTRNAVAAEIKASDIERRIQIAAKEALLSMESKILDLWRPDSSTDTAASSSSSSLEDFTCSDSSDECIEVALGHQPQVKEVETTFMIQEVEKVMREQQEKLQMVREEQADLIEQRTQSVEEAQAMIRDMLSALQSSTISVLKFKLELLNFVEKAMDLLFKLP